MIPIEHIWFWYSVLKLHFCIFLVKIRETMVTANVKIMLG